MNKELTYYFYFSVPLGSLIYLAAQVDVQLPTFVRFYVNDFLIVPIVLTSCLWLIRKIKGVTSFRLSILHVLYISLLYSLIFEYWLPQFHPRYTTDMIDVGLYFLSGVLFYLLQQKSTVKNYE